MDDPSLFRQKGSGQVPVGQSQEAFDSDPSEQSGANNARIGTPVWKSFVVNKAFQEANQAGIQAEQNQISQANYANRRASRAAASSSFDDNSEPVFKGSNGRLIRKAGRQIEELNPDDWADDPIGGAEARKSLWGREIETSKQAASDAAFQIRDPAFHAQALAKQDREDMEAEGHLLQESDPRHAVLKSKLVADSDYQKRKAELAQSAWDHGARARELEASDPETWWQNRDQPTASQRRQTANAEAQAGQAQADAAEQDATREAAALQAEMQKGVTASRSQEVASRMTEIGQARGVIAQSKQEDAAKIEGVKVEAENASKDKDFFRAGDAISGIWDAVKGLGVTAPAAFYQLVEGMDRPDHYSDSAKSAFAEADAYVKEMQSKTEANQKAGTSSSVGESFREAGGSLGFSLGSMAAAIPASIAGGVAGAKIGALTGAGTGAAVGAFGAGVGAAPGAAVGATIGGVSTGAIGAVTAGMAASGAAAYRMAGASFLNESFQQIEAESMRKNGRAMNEQEKTSAYEALLPIAKNTALWEAGPEAVGNAVTLGAGKIVFGLGKPLAAKFLGTVAGKVAAAAGSLGVELGGETITNIEQSSDQQKAQAIAQGNDPNAIKADWTTGGILESFKQVAPQTLAMLGLMSGAGGALKIASKATGIGSRNPEGTQDAPPPTQIDPEQVAAAIQAIDPSAKLPDQSEITNAALIVNANDGAAGLADGVLIERELSQLDAEDDENSRIADEVLEQVRQSGDPKAIKAAEAARESVKVGRAHTVRVALKIAAGQELDTLTPDDLDALGIEAKEGKPNEKGEPTIDFEEKKPVKGQPSPPRMLRLGVDGSNVLTDEALRIVRSHSPRAADRLKTGKAQSLQKVKDQKLSMDAAANSVQGEPATGFSPSGEVFPDSTAAAPTEFDVPTRSGKVIRVAASTVEQAEQQAAGQIPVGADSILLGQAKPVQSQTKQTNEQQTQIDSNPSDSQGTGGNGTSTNRVSEAGPGDGSIDPGSAIPAGGERTGQLSGGDQELPPAFDKSVAEKQAYILARSRFSKVKKKLSDRLIEGARASTTQDGIEINPKQIVTEAIAYGMNQDQAVEYFNRVLDEELRHLAQYDAANILYRVSRSTEEFPAWMDAHYAGIWQSDFKGTEKEEIVRTLYAQKNDGTTRADWDSMSEGDKCLEAIRMMSQGENVTEAAKLWANISDSLRTAIKAALSALKQFSSVASPAIQQEITNLENALKSLTSTSPQEDSKATGQAKNTQGTENNDSKDVEKIGDARGKRDGLLRMLPNPLRTAPTNLINDLTTNRQPRARNPKADSAKPAQSGPGNGNVKPPEKASTGETPSVGRAESPRGNVADAPLEVGERVAFDRNGERLTGEITLVTKPGIRVQLDVATKDGLPKVMVLAADLGGVTSLSRDQPASQPAPESTSAPTPEAKTSTATTEDNGQETNDKRQASTQAQGQRDVLTPDAAGEQSPVADPEKIDTIAGRISFLEFESKGYSPEQVTRGEWVNLMRSERRRLDQQEEGERPNAPWYEYEVYHRDAVIDSLKKGEIVDPEVLKDYPGIAGSSAPLKVSAASKKTPATEGSLDELLAMAMLPELKGKKIWVKALDSDGQKLHMEMDAAEAWKGNQKQEATYRKLLDCIGK